MSFTDHAECQSHRDAICSDAECRGLQRPPYRLPLVRVLLPRRALQGDHQVFGPRISPLAEGHPLRLDTVIGHHPPYTPAYRPRVTCRYALPGIKRDRRKARLVRGNGPVPGFQRQPGEGAAGVAGMAGEVTGVRRAPLIRPVSRLAPLCCPAS